MTTDLQTLHVGGLAYYDSFSGFVPCKVTKITGTSGRAHRNQEVELLVTADRKSYHKGDIITTTGPYAVPRRAVYSHNGVFRIRAYVVEC